MILLDEPVKIPLRKLRVALASLYYAALEAIPLVYAWRSADMRFSVRVGMLVCFSLLFAYFLCDSVRWLLIRKPGLILSSGGVSGFALNVRVEVPWADIAEFDLQNHRVRNAPIRVYLKSPKAFIQQQPRRRRLGLRINLKLSGTPIFIQPTLWRNTADVYPILKEHLQYWRDAHMNHDDNGAELWDIYDADRRLTGRTHRRGDPMQPGDYHLVVFVWILNDDGRFFITQRALEIPGSLLWQATGGSALAGEDSLAAALREVREETGIALRPENGKLVSSSQREDHFADTWLFRQHVALEDFIPQPGETIAAQLASPAEIRNLMQQQERQTFFQSNHFEEILAAANGAADMQRLIQQSAPDELWDIYDDERRLTGRTHRRGDPMQPGDYHLVVFVWILNDDGRFFITQRAETKHFPLLWEWPGGSALAGEDSLAAALREAREETGIALRPENGTLLRSLRRELPYGDFVDHWLFRQHVDLGDFVPQPGETIAAQLASIAEIRAMVEQGTFFPCTYLDELETIL